MKPASIVPHSHRDIIQFAWLTDCGGRVLNGGEWIGVDGASALVSYPDERHGYELIPLTGQARVVLLKLPAAADSAVQRDRPFPNVATSLPSMPGLQSAIERAHRDVPPARPGAASWIADIAAVVAQWPRAGATNLARHPDVVGLDSDPAVEHAVGLIESRIDDPPSLEELSRAAHLSVRQLCRRFRQASGLTPYQYLTQRRIALARTYLFDTHMPSATIAQKLGFGSPAVFSRWFRKHEGRTPGEFRADPTRF